MNRVCHTVPIPLADVFLIGVVACLVWWAAESGKFFARHRAAAAGSSSGP